MGQNIDTPKTSREDTIAPNVPVSHDDDQPTFTRRRKQFLATQQNTVTMTASFPHRGPFHLMTVLRGRLQCLWKIILHPPTTDHKNG